MKIMHNTIKALILIPLMLSLLFAFLYDNFISAVIGMINRNPGSVVGILGGSLIILLVVIAYFYFTRYLIKSGLLRRIKDRIFFPVVIGLSMVLGLLSIFIIDTKLVSDPELYDIVARRIFHENHSINEMLDNLRYIYYRRALVNLFPIYLLFGPSLLAVQLVNMVLHIFTGVMLFSFMKEWLKSRITARLTFIFFLSVPISYLTFNFPSHDITGLFYMMLCFFLFGKIFSFIRKNDSLWKIVVLSLLLGFLTFILELSRSLGTFVFYTLLLLFIIHLVLSFSHPFNTKRILFVTKKITLLFLVPLLTYYLLKSELMSGNLNKGRFIMMFVASDTSEGKGGAYEDIADYKIYYRLIDPEDRDEMALGKYSSELHYNAFEFVELLLRKNHRLSRLGGDYWWTKTDKNNEFIDLLESVHWIYSRFFRNVLFILAIGGLLFLLTKRYRITNAYTLMILFWLFTLGILIFLGEVNPRYAYISIPYLASLAAIGFVKFPARVKKGYELNFDNIFRFNKWKPVFVIPLVLTFLVYMLVFSSLKRSFNDPHLIYEDLRNAKLTAAGKEKIVKRSEIINKELTPQEKPMKFGVSLPGSESEVTATWVYPVEERREYKVRGFLRVNLERPENIDSFVKLNGHAVIFWNDIEKKGLKVKEDYEAGYFSSRPVLADSDSITVSLTLKKIKSVTAASDTERPAIIFLEFLQLVPVQPQFD